MEWDGYLAQCLRVFFERYLQVIQAEETRLPPFSLHHAFLTKLKIPIALVIGTLLEIQQTIQHPVSRMWLSIGLTVGCSFALENMKPYINGSIILTQMNQADSTDIELHL